MLVIFHVSIISRVSLKAHILGMSGADARVRAGQGFDMGSTTTDV